MSGKTFTLSQMKAQHIAVNQFTKEDTRPAFIAAILRSRLPEETKAKAIHAAKTASAKDFVTLYALVGRKERDDYKELLNSFW
jgi:hypothetical protein